MSFATGVHFEGLLMTNIPEDIEPILREIDQEMKGNGIKPHQRAQHAVISFGQKFNIGLPLVPLGFQYIKSLLDWQEGD